MNEKAISLGRAENDKTLRGRRGWRETKNKDEDGLIGEEECVKRHTKPLSTPFLSLPHSLNHIVIRAPTIYYFNVLISCRGGRSDKAASENRTRISFDSFSFRSWRSFSFRFIPPLLFSLLSAKTDTFVSLLRHGQKLSGFDSSDNTGNVFGCLGTPKLFTILLVLETFSFARAVLILNRR